MPDAVVLQRVAKALEAHRWYDTTALTRDELARSLKAAMVAPTTGRCAARKSDLWKRLPHVVHLEGRSAKNPLPCVMCDKLVPVSHKSQQVIDERLAEWATAHGLAPPMAKLLWNELLGGGDGCAVVLKGTQEAQDEPGTATATTATTVSSTEHTQ